jgi:hypothetical protein
MILPHEKFNSTSPTNNDNVRTEYFLDTKKKGSDPFFGGERFSLAFVQHEKGV